MTSVLKISDGQQILWAGKKVIDADVASFPPTAASPPINSTSTLTARVPTITPQIIRWIWRRWMSGSLLIYIVKDRDLLDQRLSIIKIADPELELDIGINVTDSNRAYVISEGNVRTVRTAGKMVRIKQPDGDFSPLFAHDDRYVYAFLEGDMWRYKTARPEAAYIDDFDDLIIDEGKYRLYGAESKFIPHGTAEKKR
ncbi:hypothetical protein [Klebsiella spallanzanii]|uniref:hypothetical protein n=1 Tax=Klebsiella spallanzanii TaxID=2587528 RepID=UPI00115E0651|nr:hypothetical protein [Klebsiella spallanzanii]